MTVDIGLSGVPESPRLPAMAVIGARLTSLGARVLADCDDHIVLADIEGNEFCVLRPDQLPEDGRA